nr:DUF6053 domain-containing protein [Lysobacter enzymogenes]
MEGSSGPAFCCLIAATGQESVGPEGPPTRKPALKASFCSLRTNPVRRVFF